jgi:hypothetical protein
MGIAAERGNLADMTADAEHLADEHPKLPMIQLARPFIKAETGQHGKAAALFKEIVKDGYVFPYPQTHAACLARCAEIALRLGESERYEALYRELEGFQGGFATPAGITSRGSIHLSLARLASALGRDMEAKLQFEAAEQAHARLRAPLMQARTDLALGEALVERDPDEAVRRLSDAKKRALEHGGTATVNEADKLLRRAREQQCARPSSALLS